MIRYMGTKRTLAPIVRKAIQSVTPAGRAVDLFSGMGSVAQSLAPHTPIVTNDLLSFTTLFARARFLEGERRPVSETVKTLLPFYVEHQREMKGAYASLLSRERTAIEGNHRGLGRFMKETPHVGNSQYRKRLARECSGLQSVDHYRLVLLYFSASYFSCLQAITLDSIRYAIDMSATDSEKPWMLSAWLASASNVINAPGHTAQFLKPSDGSWHRLLRQWKRDPWEEFLQFLEVIQPIGDRAWRASNDVVQSDALSFFETVDPTTVATVYADPPYTRDQYSRYYHVYETMSLYDFPDSTGEGRYRGDRFTTGFSKKTQVEDSFKKLFASVVDAGAPLVLSYPANGLLGQSGAVIDDLLDAHFNEWRKITIPYRHSTLGASSGSAHKQTLEEIYVCQP